MIRILSFILCLLLLSCSRPIVEQGKASYYADKYKGRKTSNGETYRHRKMTAAHKTLPFGTKVTVTNLQNGRKVRVRINDRGPFVAGRIIDLSKKAARKLDMVNDGVVPVEVKYRR
jgi:rare lipoprotein A